MPDVSSTVNAPLSPFERHVKHALRYLADPQRLERESPLASAYMLGRALPGPAAERSRGEALVHAIRAAAAQLWPGPLPQSREAMLAAIADVRGDPADPRYAYVVLELRAFHDFITPNRMSDIWEHEALIPGSKSQHYRDFDAAVKQLAVLLLDQLRPALRREYPRAPQALYGYDHLFNELIKALEHQQTIHLSGPGGVGKTSLTSRAVAHCGARPLFWYTVRSGFNDGVNSLLFALGAFLHEHGAAGLWQYLAGLGGAASDLNLATGLLREDLAKLAPLPPILCFDDLEHLAVANLGLPAPAHTQILDLLEGLHGSVTMVLISQRPVLSGDVQLELTGLDVADVRQLCAAVGRELTPDAAQRLHAYTGGNPRLITLLLRLPQADAAAWPPEGYNGAQALLPAFQRLWRRLTSEERRVLQQLAVYPYPAPADVFPAAVLAQLEQLAVIETNALGGVVLLPALAAIVLAEVSVELRLKLHRQAALVRLERGDVTAAAYHFAQSGDENRAVQAWFPQRRQALARGEADLARPIFFGIVPQRLSKAERKALDLIRAELRKLAGEHAEALHELESADWADQSEAGARLWMLRGELQTALGYPEQALISYGESFNLVARLLGQQALLHQRRGVLLHRQRNLAGSWQAIQRAEFDLEILRGLVREEEGAYPDALAAYGRALALAEQLADDALLAQAERQFAALHGRREELDAAITHATRAISIYERIGDRVNLEKLRSNLAAIYVQTRRFAEALAIGAPTYAFFQSVRDPYFSAVTAANLAEAAFGAGDLPEATHYAQAVLSIGDTFATPYAHYTLGQVALQQQQTDAAVAGLRESMQQALRNDDPYMAAYAQRALGEALLIAGEPAAAEEHITSALEAFRRFVIPSEVAATEALLATLHMKG
jgi:tetratricopeptide (TPR) repeat protein